VGWAFQLQEPGVVAALLMLAVAITANLLGLFEYRARFRHRRRGHVRQFARSAFVHRAFGGLCGHALHRAVHGQRDGRGAAAAIPAAMLLFVSLGLGIALPFLAIAFSGAAPRLAPSGRVDELVPPRDGGAMGLTALGLLWLASALAAMALRASALCWRLSCWRCSTCWAMASVRNWVVAAGAGHDRGGRDAAAIILPRTIQHPGDEGADMLGAQAFSEAALGAALGSGQPVFVYFTADWCLTCKVNERVAIERPETRDAFAKAGVKVFKGDWTCRDPAITRYLTAHGAAGVPLYAWYAKGAKQPSQLPLSLARRRWPVWQMAENHKTGQFDHSILTMIKVGRGALR
jgi:thiol:disulfide interchange protein